MTMRLSIISFAGIARTLVAVGMVSEADMFRATAAAAPRRTFDSGPAAGAAAGFAAGAGAAAGFAAAAGAGAATGLAAGTGAGGVTAGAAGAGTEAAGGAGVATADAPFPFVGPVAA